MSHNAPGAADPARIKKVTSQELLIVWKDGHESHYMGPVLRGQCPCASCQDEDTGERLVLPMHISDDLEFRGIEMVGRYALQFDWSDGHHTGIYSFDHLRRLCPCAVCRSQLSRGSRASAENR
jgi:DUF971 family protein